MAYRFPQDSSMLSQNSGPDRNHNKINNMVDRLLTFPDEDRYDSVQFSSSNSVLRNQNPTMKRKSHVRGDRGLGRTYNSYSNRNNNSFEVRGALSPGHKFDGHLLNRNQNPSTQRDFPLTDSTGFPTNGEFQQVHAYNRIECKLDKLLEMSEKNCRAISDLQSKFTQHQNTIDYLENRNDELMNQLEFLQREHRSNTLMFSGDSIATTDEHSPEALFSSVNKACESELGISIPENMVSSCKVFHANKSHFTIMVAFSSLFLRKKIISEAITRRKDRLFVNEYLTKTQYNMLRQLRNLRATFKMKMTVFSRDGITCCKILNDNGDKGPIIRLFRPEDFQKLEEKLKMCSTGATSPAGISSRRSSRGMKPKTGGNRTGLRSGLDK